MADAVAVTDNTFESEVLNSPTPVLVDFWAEWCQPCRMLAPHLDKVATEQGEKLKVVKLNVDENQQTAATYGILAIPTMVIFRNGSEAHRIQGALPKRRLEAELDPVLA